MQKRGGITIRQGTIFRRNMDTCGQDINDTNDNDNTRQTFDDCPALWHLSKMSKKTSKLLQLIEQLPM